MNTISTAAQELLGEWRDGDIADGEAAAAFYALVKVCTVEPTTSPIVGVNWEDEYDQAVTYVTGLEQTLTEAADRESQLNETLAKARDHQTSLKEQLGAALAQARESKNAATESIWEGRARILAQNIAEAEDLYVNSDNRSDSLRSLAIDADSEARKWDA